MARLFTFRAVSRRLQLPTEPHTLSMHHAMFPEAGAPTWAPQPDPNITYRVIIVGAGPGGISAARRAAFRKCTYFVFEKGVLANTIAVRYSLGKHVMAHPRGLELPKDHVTFESGSKEQVLQQFTGCVVEHRLQIQTQTEVTDIVHHDGVYEVQTTRGVYRATSVVLATGQGNLRELDANIAGAQLPHVQYTLADPKAYTGQHLLTLGAGDSAAQAALMLADTNSVTIVNRSPGFRRMNPQLKGQIDEQVRHHKMNVFHNAHVVEIQAGETILEVRDEPQQPGKRVSVKADWVLVQMGAEPPELFLERAGVGFRKVEGSVIPTLKQSDSPLEQYQAATTDGVYLIGSLLGGNHHIKRAIQDGAAVIDHILGLHPPSPGEEKLMHTFAGIPGGDVDAKLRYLTACAPLLYAVPSPQLRDMALLSTIHHVGAGQTIGLEEGKYATALYMVIDGRIALSDRANPQHAMTLRQGEFFGEELLLDRPFAASAISVTAAVLLAIPRRKILELMQRVPSLQQQIESVQTLRFLWRSLAPDLDLDQVRWLATQATRLSFHKDDTLFSQGERADAVYILLQGSITLSGRNNEGIDYVITYLGSGAYFGEIALLHTTTDTDRREATATVASRTCQVLRIHKADFLTFLEAHPDLKKQIERERSQRVLQQAVCATPRI